MVVEDTVWLSPPVQFLGQFFAGCATVINSKKTPHMMRPTNASRAILVTSISSSWCLQISEGAALVTTTTNGEGSRVARDGLRFNKDTHKHAIQA
jgi:hypothetical protein